jgi:hypothetical protein
MKEIASNTEILDLKIKLKLTFSTKNDLNTEN